MAVFSPTPGTPGMLSAESPINPNKSMTWAGSSSPYRSRTSSGPHTVGGLPPRPGRYMRILSLTSWAKSLSGVIMKTSKPSFSARLAKHPMRSSASYPGACNTGMRMPSKIFTIHGTLSLMSSGVSSRLAL